MVPRQVAGVMRTCEKRRVITVAIENMVAISSASRRRSARPEPPSDSDTITPTPAMTAAMASQVATETFSPRNIQANSAASSGTPACISRMLATVV